MRSDTEKKVAIIQSSYIPWKGYFDIIAAVDEFILLDEVQFSKNDWRNRNLIKTPAGLLWLTIPVALKGKGVTAIKDVRVASTSWQTKHWKSIRQYYSKAPYFRDYSDRLEELYRSPGGFFLSDINYMFLVALCELLQIDTPVTWSSDYHPEGKRTARVVDLCRKAGATQYLSGPKAKEYIQPELFEDAGIKLEYMDYSEYPEYPQQFGAFQHGVSAVDLILNTGPSARSFMKH